MTITGVREDSGHPQGREQDMEGHRKEWVFLKHSSIPKTWLFSL